MSGGKVVGQEEKNRSSSSGVAVAAGSPGLFPEVESSSSSSVTSSGHKGCQPEAEREKDKELSTKKTDAEAEAEAEKKRTQLIADEDEMDSIADEEEGECYCRDCLIVHCPHCKQKVKCLQQSRRCGRAVKSRQVRHQLSSEKSSTNYGHHHFRRDSSDCSLCFSKVFLDTLRWRRLFLLEKYGLKCLESRSTFLEMKKSEGDRRCSLWHCLSTCLRGVTMVTTLAGICCYALCCPPIPSYTINKVAFQPPRKVNYYFVSSAGWPIKKAKKRYLNESNLVLAVGEKSVQVEDKEQTVPFFVESGRKTVLACCLLRTRFPSTPANETYTLLFSHPNGVDISQLTDSAFFPTFSNAADYLRADVCIYDYAGYGISSGSATETNIYRDAHSVYETLIGRFNVRPDRVILWGYSIGVPASIDLASKLQASNKLAGMVLVSGLCSAFAFVSTMESTEKASQQRWKEKEQMAEQILNDHRKRRGKPCCIDQFYSLSKLEKITIPTLFCHGTMDAMVSAAHSIAMAAVCPGAVVPLWLSEVGHNTVILYEEYWSGMGQFLSSLRRRDGEERVTRTNCRI